MRIQRALWSLVFALLVVGTSFADVMISVSFAPPELPVYEQPLCPGQGYIWTPGYWAWDPDNGYYWVPGTWVLAPEVGFLWTPGWWGWSEGFYIWHPGYWGPEVGFYGGINYGYGYFGNGYQGGYWRDRQFYYNWGVNNVNVTNITNVYNTTVVNNRTTAVNVSYNGGPGGVTAQPTPQQQAFAQQRQVNMTPAQAQHEQSARGDRQLLAAVNHGKPVIAATTKPAELHGHGVVPATSAAPYNPPPRSASSNASPPSNARSGNSAPSAPGRNEVPRPPHASRPENAPASPPPAPRKENSRNTRPNETPRPNENAQPAPRPQPQPRTAKPHTEQPSPVQPQPKIRPKNEPKPQSERTPRPELREQEAPAPRSRQQEQPRPQAEPRSSGAPPQEQRNERPAKPPHKDGEHPDTRPPQ